MAITIEDFLKQYNLVDKQLSSYDNDTIQTITEVINGKIDNYIDSENGVVLLYIGLCYKHIKKDTKLAEQYFLMSAKYNNSNAMNNLGFLYDNRGRLDLSEKYYLMAIEHANNNSIAMNNLGRLYGYGGAFNLAEKYYLMAIEQNSKMALYNLGMLYEGHYEFNLAIKYYMKAIIFEAVTIKHIVRIISSLSYESQLEILELVVQIRTNDEYLMKIPEEVRTVFANKKIEMTRCLSHYLIGDLVDICLSYY